MDKGNTIKEMYREERPYEKCEQYGAENLTDIELLAVLLRTGTKGENSLQLAQKILHPDFAQEGILNIHRWTVEQLMDLKGIGKVKAIQILCLSELAKRLSKAEARTGLDFSAPETIAQYYMEEMRHSSKEVLTLLFLNTTTRLIGESDLSIGTVNRTIVSPREVFVEALKKKPTSNRIVLPTYNMENIMKSLDDKNYLPSLASIQFGKHGEKLIVHMHLRALEAKQFLKINICEIEYLVQQLKEKAISFEEVEIVISAFRVQKKEKFHCFLKSEIDMLTPTKLSAIVSCKNFPKLSRLFKEKRDGQETVIKTKGIETVYRAMQDFNMESAEVGKKKVYSKEVLSLLEQVLDVYEKLDKIHKTESIQSDQEKFYENNIDNLLEEIIKSIEKLQGENVL